MTKIPFSVSSRAARLIGRENVSNAEGALIELVKNSYDADASKCIVMFSNQFKGIPNNFTKDEYEVISSHEKFNEIDDCFILGEDHYTLNVLTAEKTKPLQQILASYYEIFIIDDGTGMTDEIIKNQWMMIGTNNKLNNYISKKKRVQTGAKGIGRFALDRLGSNCELFTIPETGKKGYVWKVNWEDFEKTDTSIDKVYADFESIEKLNISDIFNKFSNDKIKSLIKDFKHGTVLKISKLRDIWTEEKIKNIYDELELLTPAETFHDFKMYVFDSNQSEKYGEVKSFINEDYDYAVKAKFESGDKIFIQIFRNEFDVARIDNDLFKREAMQKFPYRLEDFKKGHFEQNLTIKDLLPGFDNNQLLEEVGSFEFNFYFIKKGTSSREKRIFFFKDINESARDTWLERFEGIKLFRDKFRIRPYGEKGSVADWLGLGNRAQKSPAGFAQRPGEYKIRAYQTSGEINISRLTNINFEDKSSREGLQETESFKLFRNVLLEIIAYFERDREKIGINMRELYEEKEKDEKFKNDAEKIANEVTKGKSEQQEDTLFSEADVPTLKEEKETLAKGFNVIKKEKEELLTELKMLRTLASSGLVITTFAHELRQLGSTLSRRADEIELCLKAVVDLEKLSKVPSHRDPYKRIARLKEDDIKLKNWIDFSIDAVQKDKRERIKVDLGKYIINFADYWNDVITYKKAKIEIRNTGKNEIKVFPVDIDSILNNLLANSLYAFLRKDAPNERVVHINTNQDKNFITIEYTDTGPGLEKSIRNPDQIFDLFFTTKVGDLGEKTGTGLGLWIVKSIMKEYKGKLEITKNRPGFGIKLYFPII